MRVLLIIVDDLHPPPPDLARFHRLGARLLPAGSSLTAEPVDIGPPIFYESSLGMALAVPGIVRKLVEGRERYDAAILGCYGDPGLAAAREVADFPIVGAGEACAHFACLLGARFGIVTLMDSDIPVIETNLNTITLGHKCVSIRAINMPIQHLADDVNRTVSRLIEEGHRVVGLGADVLILGCFGFSLLECAARVADGVGVPVLDPLAVSVKTAEVLVSGRYKVSRRAYPAPDLSELQDSGWLRGAGRAAIGGDQIP